MAISHQFVAPMDCLSMKTPKTCCQISPHNCEVGIRLHLATKRYGMEHTYGERENRIGLDPELKTAARTIFFLQKKRKHLVR